MDDTQKKQRRLEPAWALAYVSALPHLQKIARKHGYALAVHGSMATDLDLIAAPWTEEASDAQTLIEAIREDMRGHIRERPEGNPTQKPHGRLAWSIHCTDNYGLNGPYLDISVMPRAQEKEGKS